VKIADFGISKLSPKDITQPRTKAGTDGYMAPECFGINNQTTKSSYTHAVDIWSLGCLTLVLHPDQGDSVQGKGK
jgi:serine/threonine protein kinase